MTTDAVRPAPPAGPNMRPRRSSWLKAVVICALVVVPGVSGWSWRHPQAFNDAEGWASGSSTWKVNQPLYVGMSYEQPDAQGTITIHSVKAVDLSAPDEAIIDFFICRIAEDGDASTIGAATESTIHDECAVLVPAKGAKLELNASPRQQLVVGITLTAPGTMTMTGLDVSYSHGWQRGTQRIGGQVYLTAKAKRP